MYLITLRLLTRGSVKLHKEVMLSYNSQRAFKEKKEKGGGQKAGESWQKDKNSFEVESAKSFICIKIKVIGVLDQGTLYLVLCRSRKVSWSSVKIAQPFCSWWLDTWTPFLWSWLAGYNLLADL